MSCVATEETFLGAERRLLSSLVITAGKPFKNKWSALKYFEEHLTTENYHSDKGKSTGIFLGKGWERLIKEKQELRDRLRAEGKHVPQRILKAPPEEVSQKFFVSLCDGFDPFTGKKLFLRKNTDGDRRVFFDFTCSAFKSASLLEAGLKRGDIRKIHEAAAMKAITAMEKYAASRIRKNGQHEDRITGNFIATAFTHTTSRANDPQLHTHFLIFNTTYDPVDKCWKALQPGLLYEASRYATLVYQNAFIKAMHERGFEFIRDDKHFQIKGVSKETIVEYSKRAQERDKLIAEKMKKDDVPFLTGRQIADLLYQNRPEKTDKENKLKPEESAALKELWGKTLVRQKQKGPPPPPGELENLAMTHAAEDAFERKSVVFEFELLESALRKGVEKAVDSGDGGVDIDVLLEKAHHDSFIRRGLEITRQEIIDEELGMIKMVRAGQDQCLPIAPGFQPGGNLDEEQRNVVVHLLRSQDRITGFRGLAGTGKTVTLKEIQRACSCTVPPTKVLFCAPTKSAVETLAKDGITNPKTLQELLQNPTLQKSIEGGVMVLDEAGLVGCGNMHDLFALAGHQKARVILCGDTSQHKSVPRGDALRILENYSDYKYLQIQTIRRQREQFYRNAVEWAAKNDPQKALDILDHKKWVFESKGYQQEAAEAYVDIVRAAGKPKAGEIAPVVMTAPTWAEIDAVTENVRTCLQKDGTLPEGDDVTMDTFRSEGWTQAKKRCVSEYEVGHKIGFYKAVGGFEVNEQVTVVGKVDDSSSPRKRLLLRVRRANNDVCLFDPRSGGGFDVGEFEKRPFCRGDLILFQANRKQRTSKPKSGGKANAFHHFVNGTTAEIEKIVNGQIILTDGRILPRDYHHFTHGYCLTSHMAQGKTAEAVIVVANGSSRMVNREQFYVSISRGRSECRVYTNNKLNLRRRILETSERKAGIELVQELCVKQSQTILKRRASLVRSKTSSVPLPTTPPMASPTSAPSSTSEESTPDIDL